MILMKVIMVIYVAIIMLINLTLGAWSIIEILSWFGKSIPLLINMIIGLFVGEVSIPIAIVGYLLKLFEVF